jgi:large subunit ribosomal protein L6
MVRGVTDGFSKVLEIHGVGYRAEVTGRKLRLSLGFSHFIELGIPEGITVSVQEGRIRVEGADRHDVGQFASDVRGIRPPEPYKGKGIRYATEHVRRKVGKAGTA